MDNFKTHTGQQTTLQQLGGQISLHLLPLYSPDDNPIERFWRDFYNDVTRNQRYKTMHWLRWAAERYLQEHNRKIAQPASIQKAA